MVFTQETSTSWFGRLKSALVGTLIGLLLFIAGFPILWWNEGRAKRQGDAIAEVAKNVVSVDSDNVDAGNDGKPVFVFGHATTQEALTDPNFPISTIAFHLKRDVEMYQWREKSKTRTENKVGGGKRHITEYYYEKEWSSTHYDSTDFHEAGHRNPGGFPVESWSASAESGNLGSFQLSTSVIGRMTRYERSAIDPAGYEQMPFEERAKYKPHEGGLYMGASPGSPTVGDVRIKWTEVPPANVSVLGLQRNGVLDTYKGASGGTFLEVKYGQTSPDTLVAAAESKEKMMRWGLRIGGFLAMFIGLRLMMGIVSAVAYVLPFLGRIADFGIGIVAFLVALPCALLTISVAWIFVRPLIGIPLLLVALGSIVFLFMGLSKAKPQPQNA